MKTTLFLSLVFAGVLTLSSCGGSSHESHNHKTEEVTDVQYTCPMHPEIAEDEPGSCPKCNMKLEEKKENMEMEEDHSH